MRNRVLQVCCLAGLLAIASSLGSANAVAQDTQADERERAEALERQEALRREQEALQRAEREAAQRERLAQRQQAQREREALQRQREEQRAEREAERAEREAERAERRSELERARAELEEAAREVARLSRELAAPFASEVAQRFRFAGRRALLGVNIDNTEQGARIVGVSPNGPAAAAGLSVGDVIVAVDGTEIAPSGDQSPTERLVELTTSVEPGQSVVLTVQRDGERSDFTVQTRELSARNLYSEWSPSDFDFNFDFDFPEPAPNPFVAWSGWNRGWRNMQLVTLTPELGTYFGAERGILVVRGPEIEGLDLRDGDVILDISGREPTSPEHAMRILRSFAAGETLRITIMRRQRRDTIEYVLPSN